MCDLNLTEKPVDELRELASHLLLTALVFHAHLVHLSSSHTNNSRYAAKLTPNTTTRTASFLVTFATNNKLRNRNIPNNNLRNNKQPMQHQPTQQQSTQQQPTQEQAHQSWQHSNMTCKDAADTEAMTRQQGGNIASNDENNNATATYTRASTSVLAAHQHYMQGCGQYRGKVEATRRKHNNQIMRTTACL